jgi:hypothetical protein
MYLQSVKRAYICNECVACAAGWHSNVGTLVRQNAVPKQCSLARIQNETD